VTRCLGYSCWSVGQVFSTCTDYSHLRLLHHLAEDSFINTVRTHCTINISVAELHLNYFNFYFDIICTCSDNKNNHTLVKLIVLIQRSKLALCVMIWALGKMDFPYSTVYNTGTKKSFFFKKEGTDIYLRNAHINYQFTVTKCVQKSFLFSKT
jgi:hypothetical protein